MALTKSFKELVQGRVTRDPAFAAALLRQGIDTMLTGEMDTGKAILRDYIKATAGFEKFSTTTGTQPKSLIRMFGPRGNPQARNMRTGLIVAGDPTAHSVAGTADAGSRPGIMDRSGTTRK
jgi:hypothetical protein